MSAKLALPPRGEVRERRPSPFGWLPRPFSRDRKATGEEHGRNPHREHGCRDRGRRYPGLCLPRIRPPQAANTNSKRERGTPFTAPCSRCRFAGLVNNPGDASSAHCGPFRALEDVTAREGPGRSGPALRLCQPAEVRLRLFARGQHFLPRDLTGGGDRHRPQNGGQLGSDRWSNRPVRIVAPPDKLIELVDVRHRSRDIEIPRVAAFVRFLPGIHTSPK